MNLKKHFFICILTCLIIAFSGFSDAREVTLPGVTGELTTDCSDELFIRSSYIYSQELARLSLCTALSSFTVDEISSYGVSSEQDSRIGEARATDMLKAYEEMGFGNVQLYHYDESLNETADKAAFSFASRQLPTGETLVAAIIRGGGYGNEWSSNMHVGTDQDEFHQGFFLSMQDVYTQLLSYIEGMDKVKIWTTGYSRGAAISNLLAGALDAYAEEAPGLQPEDIYAYTFAAPQGVKESQNPHADLYNNIFNIVNPGDLVPAVALSEWGFTRYGITRSFNTKAGLRTKIKVKRYFHRQTGKRLNVTNNLASRNAVKGITNILADACPTVSSSEKAQKALGEILEYFLTFRQTGTGEWQPVSPEDYEAVLTGRHGDAYRLSLQKANEFLDETAEGIVLAYTLSDDIPQETLALIFAVFDVHGTSIGDLYNIITSLIDIDYFFDIMSTVFSVYDVNGGILTRSHFAQVYLAWLSLPEKNTFGEVLSEKAEEKTEEKTSGKKPDAETAPGDEKDEEKHKNLLDIILGTFFDWWSIFGPFRRAYWFFFG